MFIIITYGCSHGRRHALVTGIHSSRRSAGMLFSHAIKRQWYITGFKQKYSGLPNLNLLFKFYTCVLYLKYCERYRVV